MFSAIFIRWLVGRASFIARPSKMESQRLLPSIFADIITLFSCFILYPQQLWGCMYKSSEIMKKYSL